MESREDLRFRLGVEPVYSRYHNEGVPPGTIPHHYVSYYVSTHPNEDIAKYPKAKPFRERKTPYPDLISDMKRPFDHPHDMPTYVVYNLEVRDLPTLPRNLNWCYPELNMYAQIGMFPLCFQKELYDYYNESIATMCDAPEEYRTLQQHFDAIDDKCGSPHNMDVPLIVQADWHKWSHSRTMNAGYFLGDSYKWAMDMEDSMLNLMRINPPLSTRPPKQTPNGLFPQNWLVPEHPDELEPVKAHSKVLAALIMDDYEHRSSTDYLSPGFPISQFTVPEQRIRRAGHWMDLSYNEVDIALEYAQVLVDEERVQYQGRVLQFPQETVND
eukprot:2655328-Amphidinium_carterae.1